MKLKKILPFIIVLIFGFFVSLLYLFLETSNAHTAEDVMRQVVAGEMKEFPIGTKFYYTEKGASYSKSEENEFLTSSPIYSKNADYMVIPEYAIYVKPSGVEYKQIPCFTKVTFGVNTIINNKQISEGFIFDGIDTYTFLEDSIIELNGVTRDFAAYSTITVYNNNFYCLYEFGSEEVEYGEHLTSALKVSTTNYTVDIFNDVLYTRDDEKILIYNDPMSLEVLE